MKKFVKILSLLAIVLVATISLASCSSYDFYSEYTAAGAEIDEDADYKFEVVTVDDIKTYKDNKKNFVVFIGTDAKQTCVSRITTIAEEAENINYDGVFLYVNVKDILTSLSEHKSAIEKLGVREIDDSVYGLIAVCYEDGEVYFDTSNPNKYSGNLVKFCSKGGNPESDISFRAITDYIKYECPTNSLDDLK